MFYSECLFLLNVFNSLSSALQKELGQKDRLLQQQQMKMDETLRKLTDTSNQQVQHRAVNVLK